jgi:transcriptional regulator with XRE-family HTH domain
MFYSTAKLCQLSRMSSANALAPALRTAAPASAGAAFQNVGVLIRRERHKRGLTLVQVAERATISPAFLSLVERGKATPSLGSLAAIADALGLPIAALLQAGLPADAVTRAGRRPRFALGQSEVQYERLSTVFPGQQLDAVAIHVPPGHEAETISHPGEEWIYLLAGQLRLVIDREVVDLASGDTYHFRGDAVHSYANPGRSTATVLWVGTVPVFRRPTAPTSDHRQDR